MQLACEQYGLSDFGDDDAKEGLSCLLESVRRDARLNVAGRIAFHADTLRLLGNLLWLVEVRKRNPEIAREEIRAPIIITGLPRTASTFLQALFMQDPAVRSPRVWEVAYPRPAKLTTLRRRNVWETKIRRQLKWLDFIEPEFQYVHPLEPNSPQECTEILSNVFESLRFDSTYDVPTYRHWVDSRSSKRAYEFHRRFLQVLQYRRSGRRWVLKSPDHVFAMAGLMHAYPDAKIIVTHRDPAKVIPSVAAQTMILHGLFSDAVTVGAVTEKVYKRWLDGAEKLIKMGKGEMGPIRDIKHVFYEDLVRDPLAKMEQLYDSLEMDLSDEARTAMSAYLRRSASGKYQPNRFRKEAGAVLTPAAVRDGFSAYIRTFDIALEA